jgi:hypothetical protein
MLRIRYTFAGIGNAELGTSVAGVGDVNGDSIPDFIIGAPYAGEYPYFGEAHVFSGADGGLLYKVTNRGGADILGWSVAGAGDVNGDGYADFMAGAPFANPGGRQYAGSAYVYSGADGSVLYQVDGFSSRDHLGLAVAGAGDVNSDGRDDFMVGAPLVRPEGSTDSTGAVYVFSGADGRLLYQFFGSRAGERFGEAVSGAGDVNADGKPDFLVGAPPNNAVFVYSGADGAPLYRLTGTGGFGTSLGGNAEINGDGFADFIVGAPRAGDLGRAYVYSGADGDLLFELGERVARGDLGYSVAIPGDMNRDGTDDFLVGAPGALPEFGAVVIFSGATGSRLCQIDLGSPNYIGRYGQSVAGIGDIDRDDRPDILVGAPRSYLDRPFLTGAAWVYTADVVPPVITCPVNISVSVCPGSNSAAVGFNVSAIDGCPVPDLVCVPSSGSSFPVGVTAVTCIASDVSGNKDTCQFSVSVAAEDLAPPVLLCPSDTFPGPDTVFCLLSADSGVAVSFTVTGFDNCSDTVLVDCTPPSGSIFPAGIRVVSCTGTDGSGNSNACSFSVGVFRKGDLNQDEVLTTSDVMLLINCVFLSIGNCDLCFADANCSGNLSPADVVLELHSVFLNAPLPC